MASPKEASIWRKVLRHELRQWIIWEPNHVECAIDLERGEVLGQIEFVGGVRTIEDQVEGKFPRLSPVLFPRVDKVFGA